MTHRGYLGRFVRAGGCINLTQFPAPPSRSGVGDRWIKRNEVKLFQFRIVEPSRYAAAWADGGFCLALRKDDSRGLRRQHGTEDPPRP